MLHLRQGKLLTNKEIHFWRANYKKQNETVDMWQIFKNIMLQQTEVNIPMKDGKRKKQREMVVKGNNNEDETA